MDSTLKSLVVLGDVGYMGMYAVRTLVKSVIILSDLNGTGTYAFAATHMKTLKLQVFGSFSRSIDLVILY